MRNRMSHAGNSVIQPTLQDLEKQIQVRDIVLKKLQLSDGTIAYSEVKHGKKGENFKHVFIRRLRTLHSSHSTYSPVATFSYVFIDVIDTDYLFIYFTAYNDLFI